MSVWHPLPGWVLVAALACVAITGWPPDGDDRTTANILVTGIVAASTLAAGRDASLRVLVVLVVVATCATVRASSSWHAVRPDAVGEFEGWARVVGDPQPFPSATRVVLELDGERYEHWARGRARRLRVGEWSDGDRILAHGVRDELDSDRRLRVVSQHVVGQVELEWVADVRSGSPIERASGRVRQLLERGSSRMPTAEAALFRGLVIGDDADQPPDMIDRFRASGLSHLTAVSGQNVSFLLAAAGPMLRRLRPFGRWAGSVALIGWFAMLTRFEPSIVRAGAMAALSATAFATGRERHPARILCLAVVGLLLVDPLLVRSVGFWLSAGATAGVTTVGPWLAKRFERLGLLATPVAITLGAQLGVAVPALVVFGSLPLVSIPANVLAGPAAGAVMLYGLPAGLVAGAVPAVAPVLMLPCRIGVRWVDLVAALGARLEPGGRATLAGWIVVAGAVGVLVATRAAKNRGRDGNPPADR